MKGEKCEILILKVLKTHAFAKIVNIIEKSKYRVEPDCKTYKTCGGCSLRHIDYRETLVIKREKVQNLVNKSLKNSVMVEDTIGMDNFSYYRNKAIYPVCIDDNGKEHTNLRVLSTKMLKAREQMQNSEKEKEALKKEIQSLQEQIEDRQLDLHYADSFEQSGQIREDIQKMEAKLSSLEERIKKTVEKASDNENKPKDSILGAIKKLKEESTEKQEQKPIKGEMEL